MTAPQFRNDTHQHTSHEGEREHEYGHHEHPGSSQYKSRIIESQLRASAAPHHISRYRQLKLLAEFDQASAWVNQGFSSCAAWWSHVAGIERSTAREQIRVAKAIVELPALDRALRTGRINYAKAKVVSRVATAETVDQLIAVAIAHPSGQFTRLVRRHRGANSV